jgi:aspartyl-tRNA(Asn)/glutamyl-tRNA(Gln) amidotransferase subunit A
MTEVDPVRWQGIAELGRAYRDGSLSPVDVTQRLLARAGKHDAKCHAFLRITSDLAMEEARVAAAELASGRDRGPMHGVPYVLKDNIDVAGFATTCNSKILANNIAAADSGIASRLREAGAVLLGKTALHEFALGGGPSFDLPWPPARNPWNLSLHPGGSSSGSGAALAAGFAPAAIGTDTGGSIRHPAASCGLVGMKATHGLVSAEGMFPLAPTIEDAGPLTRNVEDNALLLGALTGMAYDNEMRAGVRGLRIGVADLGPDDGDVDDVLVSSFEEALRTLRSLGAIAERVDRHDLPSLADWLDCGCGVFLYEQRQVHQAWLQSRPEDYGALGRSRLLADDVPTESEYRKALSRRHELRGRLDAVLAGFDAIACLFRASTCRRPSKMPPRLRVHMAGTRACRSTCRAHRRSAFLPGPPRRASRSECRSRRERTAKPCSTASRLPFVKRQEPPIGVRVILPSTASETLDAAASAAALDCAATAP